MKEPQRSRGFRAYRVSALLHRCVLQRLEGGLGVLGLPCSGLMWGGSSEGIAVVLPKTISVRTGTSTQLGSSPATECDALFGGTYDYLLTIRGSVEPRVYRGRVATCGAAVSCTARWSASESWSTPPAQCRMPWRSCSAGRRTVAFGLCRFRLVSSPRLRPPAK
jgi:hypothetical protein